MLQAVQRNKRFKIGKRNNNSAKHTTHTNTQNKKKNIYEPLNLHICSFFHLI